MNEPGEHHSQQTDTRTENEIPHVLTHRRVLNSEKCRSHYTLGSVGRNREGQRGMGSWGEIAWGEIPDIGEGEEGSKLHCHMCTYATILHVLHMYPKT